jgi:SAM-dependent methyltransferase
LIYQYPKLTWQQLEPYYQGEYDSYGKLLRQEPSAIKRRIQRIGSLKQRAFVEKFCKSGHLTDVGCGNGVFLEEMQMAGGWYLTGIEPNPTAAQFAHKQLNLEIISTPFEEAQIAPNSQDILTMWNVFEHLYAPLESLRKAYDVLKPGGHMIVALPNPDSLSRHIFGKYWMGWDLPRHLFLYPIRTFEEITKKMGFDVIDKQCFMVTYFVLGNSITHCLQDLPPALKPLATWLRRAYYTPFTRLGFLPFQWLIEKSKQATVLTWVLKKQ